MPSIISQEKCIITLVVRPPKSVFFCNMRGPKLNTLVCEYCVSGQGTTSCMTSTGVSCCFDLSFCVAWALCCQLALHSSQKENGTHAEAFFPSVPRASNFKNSLSIIFFQNFRHRSSKFETSRFDFLHRKRLARYDYSKSWQTFVV